MPLTLQKEDGTECYFQDLSEIFVQFFKTHESLVKDDNKQQSFRCEYNEDNILENDDFRMFYTRIYSGVYGSSSDIIDGNTQKVKYKKKSSDIDTRPFYLMVVFSKRQRACSSPKGIVYLSKCRPIWCKNDNYYFNAGVFLKWISYHT